jgi:type II secretory pathway component GspD/PulD (secretin)
MLEGLDVLVVRGNPRDVEQVMQIIGDIERLSIETEPAIEVCQLQYVDSESLGYLVSQLYASAFSARQGDVFVTPLVKPNALLLVGRAENVKTALDLVKRLDQPVVPDTQFRVFLLKHASAYTVQSMVTEFFTGRGGLGTKARVTADFRSNALVVQASPRDMAEVADLIERLDTKTSDSVNELRKYHLENSLAQDVANTLQYAVASMGQPSMTGGMGGVGAGMTGGGAAGRMMMSRSAMLRFMTVDARGQKVLSSGILTDVKVTPDVRSNSVLVSAPADCMDLIEALIHELDQRPAAGAQIKVFTIVNADANNLMATLG